MKEKILEVYTDCACNSHSYGIGIVFIDENEIETKYQFKTTKNLIDIEFDTNTKNATSSVGEIYAVLKSLEIISGKYDKIYIYTDNNHTFKSLTNTCKEKSKHILFNKIIKKCREINISNIEFRHIKAHCDVYGNEMVDRLSKKSLKDKTIPYCNDYSDCNLSMKIFEFNFFNSYKLDNFELYK